MIFPCFSFHSKPFIEHLIGFSWNLFIYSYQTFYKNQDTNIFFYLKPLIENPNMYLLFASSSMIFLFFVRRSCRRSICLFFKYPCVFLFKICYLAKPPIFVLACWSCGFNQVLVDSVHRYSIFSGFSDHILIIF